MTTASPSAPSQALFLAASTFLTSTPAAASLSQQTKLQLYSLYKLLTTKLAHPPSARPSFWDLEGKAKWDAWAALQTRFGDTPSEKDLQEGRTEYVAIVRTVGFTLQEKDVSEDGEERGSVDLERLSDVDDQEEERRVRENHEGRSSTAATKSPVEEAGPGVSAGGGMGGGVSQMVREEDDEGDHPDLPPHSFIITPSASDLSTYLASHPESINTLDPYGYSPLHLASDRNHPELVQLLLSRGADRSLLDPDGMNALDLAMTNGAGWEAVKALLLN